MRLGLGHLISNDLIESRSVKNTQLPLSEFARPVDLHLLGRF